MEKNHIYILLKNIDIFKTRLKNTCIPIDQSHTEYMFFNRVL